jgi:hypothetical protein
MSKPDPDDHSELRDALRRDAAGMQEPPFDAALHHATIRRIRALSGKGRARPERRWMPSPAAGAAVLVLGALAAVWHWKPFPADTVSQGEGVVVASIHAPPASAWIYQRAAAQSDEALFAMLDRDARVLLPPSSSIFSKLAEVTPQ